jgi:hypothetical protein
MQNVIAYLIIATLRYFEAIGGVVSLGPKTAFMLNSIYLVICKRALFIGLFYGVFRIYPVPEREDSCSLYGA